MRIRCVCPPDSLSFTSRGDHRPCVTGQSVAGCGMQVGENKLATQRQVGVLMLVTARNRIAGEATGRMLGPVQGVALSSGRPAGEGGRTFHGECGHREIDLLLACGEAGSRAFDAMIDQAMAKDADAIVAMRVRFIELAVGTFVVLGRRSCSEVCAGSGSDAGRAGGFGRDGGTGYACRSTKSSAEGSSLHH